MGCLQSVGPTGFVPYGGRGLSNRSTTTKTSSQLHLLYDGSVEETEGMANKKPVSTIKEKLSNFKVDDAKGTDHCIKKQYRIFITLMDRVVGDASSETGVDPQ
jgi:hypothetical protein